MNEALVFDGEDEMNDQKCKDNGCKNQFAQDDDTDEESDGEIGDKRMLFGFIDSIQKPDDQEQWKIDQCFQLSQVKKRSIAVIYPYNK